MSFFAHETWFTDMTPSDWSYGAMLVLLVYGSDPQLRPVVSVLWPWGRRFALRQITDPVGHDPLTTNRPSAANLMA